MNIRNRLELIIMRIVRWAMIAESYEQGADTSKLDAMIAIREQRVKVERLKRKVDSSNAIDWVFWRRDWIEEKNELDRMEREARGEDL